VGIFFAATRLGGEAVLLFFVLSGFLVGGRIIRRAKSRTFSLKDYSVDRCSRILLPLIPATPAAGTLLRRPMQAAFPQPVRTDKRGRKARSEVTHWLAESKC
jgi:peptidoglycan/LPS O-acetylase OafA/YrhL